MPCSSTVIVPVFLATFQVSIETTLIAVTLRLMVMLKFLPSDLMLDHLVVLDALQVEPVGVELLVGQHLDDDVG